MRTLVIAAAMSLCFFGGRASAGEFLGKWSLSGRMGGRNSAAEVTFEKNSSGKLSVTRVGRFTARARLSVAPFTWTAKRVQHIRANYVRVDYELRTATLGIIGVLNGSSQATAVYRFRVSYFLSRSGALTEYGYNYTRTGSQRFWHRMKLTGAKKPASTWTPAHTPDELDALVEKLNKNAKGLNYISETDAIIQALAFRGKGAVTLIRSSKSSSPSQRLAQPRRALSSESTIE